MRTLATLLLAFYAGQAMAQWNGSTISSGTIYRSGNVGIGPVSSIPGYASLYLSGNGGLNPNLMLDNGDASADNRIWSMMAQGGSFRISTQLDNGGNDQDALRIYRSGVDVTKVTFPNGNMIFGGTSLLGSYESKGVLQVQAPDAVLSLRSTTSNASFDAYLGATWLSLTSNDVPMHISARGNYPIRLSTNSQQRMVVTADGKIGIGTSNPTTTLEVNGKITLTSGNNNYLRIGAYDVSADNFAYISSAGQTAGTGIKFETPNAGGTGGITRMTILNNGKIGIGTSNPTEALTVKGKIHTEEVRVDLTVPGPDYVFEEDYDLPSLAEIEAFIKQNKHLPEVPPAKEMEREGIKLGEMNMLLLRKIEELTLYVVEQNKIIGGLQEECKASPDVSEKMIEEMKLIMIHQQKQIEELKDENEKINSILNTVLEKK